jgi:hypothetical protein
MHFGYCGETALSGGVEAICGIVYSQWAANAHHPVALLKVFIYFEHPMGTKGSIPAARLLFLL